MSSLTQQRCHNHATREAAGRCPECGRSFCRECLTEHEDRVICAACLRKHAAPAQLTARKASVLTWACHCFLGILIAWVCFYTMGRILLSMPSSFHEGTMWQLEP